MKFFLKQISQSFWFNVFFVVGIGCIDYWSGIEFEFFILYFIPITIIARNYSFSVSCLIVIECVLAWSVSIYYSHPLFPSLWLQLWYGGTRLVTMLFVAYLVSQIRKILHNEQKISSDLRTALEEVNTLKELLPICAWCKKIKDDQGYWQQLENYFLQHSNVVFSHGLCDECAAKLRQDIETKR